jgi:hypothetical protein
MHMTYSLHALARTWAWCQKCLLTRSVPWKWHTRCSRINCERRIEIACAQRHTGCIRIAGVDRSCARAHDVRDWTWETIEWHTGYANVREVDLKCVLSARHTSCNRFSRLICLRWTGERWFLWGRPCHCHTFCVKIVQRVQMLERSELRAKRFSTYSLNLLARIKRDTVRNDFRLTYVRASHRIDWSSVQ